MMSLDRQAGAWIDSCTEACAATSIRHEQSADMLDRRMLCLADRLREIDLLTAELTRADRPIVLHAASAASNLTPVVSCDHIASLAALPPLPSDSRRRAEIDKLRADIEHARILYRFAKYDEARGTRRGRSGYRISHGRQSIGSANAGTKSGGRPRERAARNGDCR